MRTRNKITAKTTTETYEKDYMIWPYGVYLRNAKSIIYKKGHTNTIKDKIHMLISADIKRHLTNSVVIQEKYLNKLRIEGKEFPGYVYKTYTVSACLVMRH